MREILEVFTDNCNVIMQYEIFLILGIFIAAAAFAKKKTQMMVFSAVSLISMYLHRIILPFIVTGIYVFLLLGIVSVIANLDVKAFLLPVRKAAETLGICFSEENRSFSACTAIALLIILIQLSRINIAIDYDSLRYGIRSDVLLTNGKGISGFFENTGLVNAVYTYPKGFELLTRPLYFGHTYGYVLCFNIYMLILSLFAAGEIVSEITGSIYTEPFTFAALSLIPGITNMAVTAKSDLITVLCQLYFVLCAVRFIKSGDNKYCGYALACAVFSYSFKPTALVFTSVLGIAAIAWLFINKKKISFEKRGITASIFAFLFTGVITARTLIITGLPFAGVFTGLFEKLGFKLKYPFRLQNAVNTETADFVDIFSKYLKRFFSFLFCPAGEDMSHVFMAWSGIVFLVMLFTAIVFFKKGKDRLEDLKRLAAVSGRISGSAAGSKNISVDAAGLLNVLFLIQAALFLITLYLLYQVDGNYYMLFYFITVIIGTVDIYALLSYDASVFNKGQRRSLNIYGKTGICLIVTVMIYFTAFTGWAGPVGFTPIDFVNRGYYNHEVLGYKKNPVNIKDTDRVIAFSYEPECYKLCGRVESWVDIDGSGGNVYLTDTKLNIFKEYCTFADIDYIYADMYFLNDTVDERHIRAKTLFTYMLEDGDFSELIFPEGSSEVFYAKVDKKRMSVGWENEMSSELIERTEKQKEIYGRLVNE